MADKYPKKLKLSYYGKSDIGMLRNENQDTMGKFPQDNLDLYDGCGQLFIVADGLGGHKGGKEASSIAVDVIAEFYSDYINSDLLFPNVIALIKNAIEEANTRIYRKAQNSIELNRMGTTCSVLFLKENKAAIGHVGDSRIYKIEGSRIEQITKDHTQVQELLKKKIITEKEAESYPARSVLVRAVGIEEKVEVDIISNIELKAGQQFVLCSDGLGNISKEEILNITKESCPQRSCEMLVNLANEKGGRDNVTVQIIKISSNKNEPAKNVKSKVLLSGLCLILLLALGLLLKNMFNIPSTGSASSEITNKSKNNTEAKAVNNKKLNENTAVNHSSGKDRNGGSDILIQEASILYNEGKLNEAVEVYRKILKQENTNLAAMNGIISIANDYKESAEIFEKNNDYPNALLYYRKVHELQPDDNYVAEKINKYESIVK